MIYEKSCGFVAYTVSGDALLYLIIQSTNGDFGFPKGHVENGESEYQTAIRELKEEVGIDVQIIPGFRHQTEYHLPNKNDVIKRSVYFLGECKTLDATCQKSEVKNAVFLLFEDALGLLSFEDTKEVLRAANTYLQTQISERF